MASRQCLPFDEDSSSDSELNFNLEEMSALKYLKQVRSERKKIPKIVSIDIPEKYRDPKEVHNQDTKQSKFDQSKEWQDIQKDTFERLQLKINTIRESQEHENRVMETLPIDLNDTEECISFCKDNEPKLSFMLALDQGRLEIFIDLLALHLAESVVENNSDVSWITKWIYSTLACLHLPLDPEAHNSIRTIAKSCIQLIDSSSEASSKTDHLPYKLLITIIANNFHQYDLLNL